MPQPNERFEIPGTLRVEPGNGGLSRISITTPQAQAVIYTHGGHVTRYQPADQPPVLWMSQSSWFENDKPIRGGVPICFPWFGPRQDRAGSPAHGFARLREWEIESVRQSDSAVVISLLLKSDDNTRAIWPGDFILRQTISIGAELTMALSVQNTGTNPLQFEEALHTYFTVGDIRQISIEGLAGTSCIDKVEGARIKQQADPITSFNGETDRVYFDTTSTCIVHDPLLRRRIEIAKSGSNDTVVWNPWINKAKMMPDFGDDEWIGMVCVETANLGKNGVELAAGQTHLMSAKVRSWPSK